MLVKVQCSRFKVESLKSLNLPFRYICIFFLLAFSVLVFISTELLSLFNLLTATAIVIFWLILLLIIIVLWTRRKKYIPSFNLGWKHFSSFEKCLLIFITFILLITFITAIAAHPNNWDSMTYHIARVMHWMQNKNVNHYPTNIGRQISQPPFAEYVILHLRLFNDNDRLANLVQWIFMCGSIICVSLIARESGGNKTTQLLSAFFAATLPMGILQSTSTQNDYAGSFFIASSVLFLLRYYYEHFFN